MELLSARHLISTAQKTLPYTNPLTPFHIRRIGSQARHFHFLLYSKKSAYQDFPGYAKPSRLLSATEANVCTGFSLEKLATSLKVGRLESLYKVELKTSGFYGSGLTDMNSGILLCLIDENGDSILERIPTSSSKDQLMQSNNNVVSDVLHFQRGSVDVFTFEGPKLQKIKALWISPESGQWRPGGVSLSIICQSPAPLEANGKPDDLFVGFRYDFATEDIVLGEGSDNSMTELKPCLVTEFSGDNFILLSENISQSSSTETLNISNEESMREYADLKNSLLLYDTLLIFAGSAIVSFSSGESAAFSFLTGGIGGFLYLLLLQRSVDELPAPDSTTSNKRGKSYQSFGSLKGAVSTLMLALTFSVIAVKFGSGNDTMVVTPKELVFGMMGFLVCKVAVLLAAFKPMPSSLKENQ